jgi:TRAP-type C4-dicarboxylate transport system substrate-binding protein
MSEAMITVNDNDNYGIHVVINARGGDINELLSTKEKRMKFIEQYKEKGVKVLGFEKIKKKIAQSLYFELDAYVNQLQEDLNEKAEAVSVLFNALNLSRDDMEHSHRFLQNSSVEQLEKEVEKNKTMIDFHENEARRFTMMNDIVVKCVDGQSCKKNMEKLKIFHADVHKRTH